MLKFQYKYWLAVLWIIYSSHAQAQPVSIGVFESVEVDAVKNGYVLRNNFTCPLRYISHYPYSESDELSIRIEPVPLCTSDFDNVKVRGSVKPRTNITNDIVEVVYEGDNHEGPSLIIYFEQPVKFSVSQGDDYRSIEVNVISE